MNKIEFEKDMETGQQSVPCPFYKTKVLKKACDECRYCSGSSDEAISCDYSDRFLQKLSSLYPADGVKPATTNDVVSNEKPSKIALDTVGRDIHEPNIEELAEFFGFNLKDVTG